MKRLKIRSQLILLYSFTFLPWNQFWSQKPEGFQDGDRVQLVLAKDCAHLNSNEKNTLEFESEVVFTDNSRQLGLGDRHTKLAPDKGMLFVFDSPQRAAFWMKNTYIPLQIAYFNTNDELFQLIEMPVEKNPKNPKKTYPSSDLVEVALEVAPRRIPNNFKTFKLCIKTKTKEPTQKEVMAQPIR